MSDLLCCLFLSPMITNTYNGSEILVLRFCITFGAFEIRFRFNSGLIADLELD